MGKPNMCITSGLTWKNIENKVKSRMTNSSLVHSLIPRRKICRRTRVLNNMIKRFRFHRTYSQYVKMKTAVLRNMSEDNETDDAESFSDEDYGIIYNTELSLCKSDKEEKEKEEIDLIDMQIEKRLNKTKTKRVLSKVKRKGTSKRKKSSDSREALGWNQIIKKRNETPNSSDESMNKRDLIESNVIDKKISRSKATRKRSTGSFQIESDVHNHNLNDNERETIDLPLNIPETEIGNGVHANKSDTQLLKESSMKEHVRKLDNDKAVIINETTDTEATQKTPENIKKNLTTLLSKVTQDFDKNMDECQDAEKTNNLNWTDLSFSNVRIVGQSTPVPKENDDVRAEHLLPKKIKSLGHPKDSGIDEDSQEDSLSDSNGKIRCKNKVRSLECKINLNLEAIHEQETVDETQKRYTESNEDNSSLEGSSCSSNRMPVQSKEPDNCKVNVSNESSCNAEEENLNEDKSNIHLETVEKESQKLQDNTSTMCTDNAESDRCAEIVKEQNGEVSLNTTVDNTNGKGNDCDSSCLEMEDEQKQKLQPKVMHTEIVNKKYRIVQDEHSDESSEKLPSSSKDVSCTNNPLENQNLHDTLDRNDELLITDNTSEKHSEILMEKLQVTESIEDCESKDNIALNSSDAVHLPEDNMIQEKEDIDTYAESEGEDMSPSATKRLQQLKRLNLFEDSESGSEDEIPSSQVNTNDKKSIFERIIKAKGNGMLKSKIENEIQKDINQNKTSCKEESNCVDSQESSAKLRCTDTNENGLPQINSQHNGILDSEMVEEKVVKRSPKRSRLSLKRNTPNENNINDTTIRERSEDAPERNVDKVHNGENINFRKRSSCGDLQDENQLYSEEARDPALINANTVISTEADSLRYILNKLNRKKRKDTDDMEQLGMSENSSCSRKERTANVDERPQKLQDLIDYRELTEEECASRFRLKEFSEDDEVFILTVPTTMDIEKLKGQKIKLKEDKIKLGKHRYNILNKSSDKMSCVFRSSKRHKRYKMVNINPIRSVIVQGRFRKDSSTNVDAKECKNKNVCEEFDDNAASTNVETPEKKIKHEELVENATETEDKYIFWKKKRLKRDFSDVDFTKTETASREKKKKSKYTENRICVEET